MRRGQKIALIISITFVIGVIGSVALVVYAVLIGTRPSDEELKVGRDVEATLIKNSAASEFASFAFLERSFGDTWSHYCVLDYSSLGYNLPQYAKQNGLMIGEVKLDSFFHDNERPNRWSIEPSCGLWPARFLSLGGIG